MRIYKKFLALVLIISGLGSAYAAEEYYEDSPNTEEDSKLVFKFRLSGIVAKSKGSGLPKKNDKQQDVDVNANLVANGFGADVATTVFFNQHIASELSLGLNVYKTKQAVINQVALKYGATPDIQKNLNVYSVPATFTFQYHIAPFGGFSPYLGAGYSLAYFYTNNKNIRVNKFNAAPVLQIGLDFIAQDNTLITLDVRKYFLTKDVYYKSSVLRNTSGDLKSKLKIDPLLISAGIGFQF
jgi:outer membrane protein